MDRAPYAALLPFMTLLVGVVGACVGSFLNVVVWRLPRNESLLHPGSHCPCCGHLIRARENIPLVSWLVLRGRCSGCALPISIRYPLVEAANMLLYLALWWRVWHGTMPLSAMVAYGVLGSILLSVSLIDLEHLLIPDEITVFGLLAAAFLALVFPATRTHADLSGILSGQGQLILGTVLDGIARLAGGRPGSPRVLAVLDMAVGTVVGYGVLLAVLEAGKRLWGRVRVHPDEPVPFSLDADGIRIGEGDLATTWDDLLFRRSDHVEIEADALHVALGEGAPQCPSEATVLVTRKTLRIGTVSLDRNALGTVRGSARAWTLPREVMGYGDPKLLAVIGAFLGGDAVIFTLLLGAVGGTLIGVALLLMTKRDRHTPLPFGPFLAGGALAWLLFGGVLTTLYGRLLLQAGTR